MLSRTETTTTWRNADGTQTSELHGAPVNWQDPVTGQWTTIDDTLTPVADGFQNRSGPLSVTFVTATAASPLTVAAGNGWSAAFGLEGVALGHPAAVTGSVIAYPDVADGVDLTYAVRGSQLKEQVVLKTPAAAATPLRFPLTLVGVEPRTQPDGSIGLFRPGGDRVALIPPAWMADASPDPLSGPRPSGAVGMALTGTAGAWVLELTPDAAWLSDSARSYPVVIDPSIDAGHATGQFDAFGSSPDPATNYNGAAQYWGGHYVDFAGYDNYPTSQQYSYQYIDLSPVMGKQILSAQWRDFSFVTQGNGYYRMWPVTDAWSDTSVTWNTLPGHRTDAYKEGYATAGGWQYQDLTDWVGSWAAGAWPSRGISLDSAGQPSGVRFAASEEGSSYNEAIVVTYNSAPVPAPPASPAAGATVMTATPTLAGNPGSDPDGDPLQYWFRASDTADPEVGQVLNSGWLSSPSWTVPAGSLQDGVTYSWKIATWDGHWGVWSGTSTFKVNLRLGDQGPSPYDGAGGARVNLANGNLEVAATSPSFPTVGGAVGVSYAYNSQAPVPFGLKAEYWDGCNGSTAWPPAAEPTLVRRDASISFNWGSGSPAPGIIGADNFCVRWTGLLTTPRTDRYCFQAVRDDGIRVIINGTDVLDSWVDQSSPSPPSDPYNCIDLLTDRTNSIEVDYYEHTGNAQAELWVGGTVGPFPVPSGWLSTTPQSLPTGWSLSAGSVDLAYSEAQVIGDSLVLVEPSGATHEYRRTGTDNAGSTWASTGDDDAVVTSALENGQTTYVVQASDGLLYTFNAKGQLLRAVSATDDVNPAAPRQIYSGDTGRLAAVQDPLSGRQMSLTYSQPNGTNVCPAPPSGFSEAPAGLLCQVAYWDGSSSFLYYSSNGQLARIADPGGVNTDFAYDASGRLSEVRSPLANDAVAAGQRVNDSTVLSDIAYDGAGRVSSVTLPAPLAGDPRPAHTYSYTSGTQTDVHVAGAPEPNGYARRVSFNGAGQVSADSDATGATTQSSWDAGDRLAWTVDPTNFKTTTIYDQAQRPTDAYGPVRADWIDPATNRPYPANAASTPHTQTAYDEGIQGLAATYWANAALSGAPAAHATGVGDPTGALNVDWGSGQPAGLNAPNGDNWSGRFTGEILLPQAGTYNFRLFADDGVRLFIDDQLQALNAWVDQHGFTASASFVNPTAGTRHRIRVDYYEHLGSAELTLYWTPPGGSEAVVPGADLFPRYGLATSSTDADGKKTATQYAVPERGLATASIIDPGGLNLRTETDYNDAWFRSTAKRLPSGAASQVNYAYYGPTETRTNPCTGGSAIPQAGRIKTTTAADPDGTGPQSPITNEQAYDDAGRVVAARVQTDAAWTCMTYDDRGRLATRTDSAGKTTTMSYNAFVTTASFVDSAGANRSTVSQVDLLGRPSRYTDEQGTVTRSTYDQAGRLTATYRTFAGQGETQLTAYAYDPAGRVTTLTEYASGAPRASTFTYDAAGRRMTTSRPNGVVTTNTYDTSRPDLTGISNQKNGTELSPWTYTNSLADRVVSEVTTGRTRNFTYDPAGRLTRTVEGATTRSYAYDANTNRCAAAASCDGSYAYDSADRLTASPYASGYSYDPHGNLISANPTTPPVPGSVNQTNTLDALGTPTATVPIGSGGGALTAGLTWASATPVSRTGALSGSLAPVATTSTAVPVDAESQVTATTSWTAGNHPTSTNVSSSVGIGATSTQAVTSTAAGTVSGTLDWSATSTTNNWSASVASLSCNSWNITPSATGSLTAALTWSSGLSSYNLSLYDGAGNSLAGGGVPSTSGSFSLSYIVPASVTYAAPKTYTLKACNYTSGSTVNLTSTYPVTANLGLELWSGSTKLASGSPGAKPQVVSAANQAPGTYTFKVVSHDFDAAYTLSSTYQVVASADLSLALKNPAGSVVASARSASGTASLAYHATSGGAYSLVLTDNSSDLSVPSYNASWGSTTLGHDVASGSLPVSGSATRAIATDGAGYLGSSLTWTQGNHPISTIVSSSVGIGATSTQAVTSTAAGTVSGSLDWNATTTTNNWSASVASLSCNSWNITASAPGPLTAALTWSSGLSSYNLSLYDGATVIAGGGVPSTSGSFSFSYSVPASVTYTAQKTYTLKACNYTSGSAVNLTSTYPVTANLGLELWQGSTRLASGTPGAKPQVVSVTNQAPGTYTFKVVSHDFDAAYALSDTYQVLAPADVTLALQDTSGATLATARSASGSLNLTGSVPSAGGYNLVLTDNSPDLAVPSYAMDTTLPKAHPAAASLALRDANGATLATANGPSPLAITQTVVPGVYNLVVSATTGTVNTTLTATYPGRPPRESITYDANDHATAIDDGMTTTRETLDPSGRVLHRVVTDDMVGTVSEDSVFGYDGPGDSPAYSRPVAGGIVTTNIDGPGGLLLTDAGGTPSYPIANRHGDIAGTTDASGTFTPNPMTDEFGEGAAPASRLGWLGARQRYDTGGNLDLVRMGVRLYDPSLGRFLGVDSVEGGSANSYDYCFGDPVNCGDLSGRSGSTKRKDLLRRIFGLQRQIDIHRQKIARELEKSDPDYGLIEHWGKEIANWESQIADAKRRLTRISDNSSWSPASRTGGALGGWAAAGAVLWWLGKAASPACGPAVVVCVVAL